MKKLAQFQYFDWNRFNSGKELNVTEVKDWEDFERKGTILGTVVEVVILTDDTEYDLKPGEMVSNRFEKFKIKVPKNNLTVKVGDFVEPVNPVATVYGEHRNQLSVKADDIVVVDPT